MYSMTPLHVYSPLVPILGLENAQSDSPPLMMFKRVLFIRLWGFW
jgi:hypothetical protein